MYLVTFAALAWCAAAFFAYAVVRDGARRNACQDRIVAEWLESYGGTDDEEVKP